MHSRNWKLLVPLPLCLACLAGLMTAQAQTATEPAWAKPLLAQTKLTPDKAQLDPNRWTGGGQYRLKTFQRLWDDWRLVDSTVRAAASDFLAADTLDHLIARAAPLIDVTPLSARKPRAPEKEGPADEALVKAITALHGDAKPPLTEERLRDLKKRTKAVPQAVARAAAQLLEAVPGAVRKRDQALKKFGGADRLPAAFNLARDLALSYRVDGDTLKLMAEADLEALVQGGQELARALDDAARGLATPRDQKFEFTWETSLGVVALNGTQDHTYGAGPYLLVIDTGGNDRYASGGATPDAAHPVSLLLDLAGNDRYEAKGGPAFGSGVLGYGLLIDVAGDDVYKADVLTCGCASFGVGLLVDRAGKDRYEMDRLGQGAALYGVGVLADSGGNDEYRCYFCTQGFGGVRGCGVLADRAGDDLYEANDKDLRYPSPQDPKHNTSLAQGAAFGRRAHPGDGHSLAGGVGILADGKGNDRYSCGVFGQGVSYWYGLAALVDVDGNDTYDGVWYCQGSAAHYGVGALCELGGNDRYKASLTMAQGSAHDYSVTWLMDAAGDDTYECPGNCMGFALYNSVGVLWDRGGTDVYKTGGAALGQAGETRPESLNLGMFIDEGGKGEFPKGSQAKPNSMWAQPAKPGHPHLYGLGMAR